MARELPYIAAIGEAIHQEMERDESVLYFGQNIATTDDDPYLKAFGSDRVRVTPISETAEIGMAVERDSIALRRFRRGGRGTPPLAPGAGTSAQTRINIDGDPEVVVRKTDDRGSGPFERMYELECEDCDGNPATLGKCQIYPTVIAGTMVSRDGGTTWQNPGRIQGLFSSSPVNTIETVIFDKDYATNKRLYAVSGTRIIRSDGSRAPLPDDTLIWTTLLPSNASIGTLSLAQDATQPSTFYSASASTGFFQSTNGGTRDSGDLHGRTAHGGCSKQLCAFDKAGDCGKYCGMSERANETR